MESQLWEACADLVVAHASKVLTDCTVEIVKSPNSKGTVSYDVPDDDSGQYGGQQATQVTALSRMGRVLWHGLEPHGLVPQALRLVARP